MSVLDANHTFSAHTQWVVPLALQLGPGLFLIVGTFYCPESPRWLAKQDRWDEAEASLSYMRELPSSDPYIREELRGIREQLDREGVVVKSAPLYQRLRLNELMLPGNRNRLGIGLVLMCCQNMTGVNVRPRILVLDLDTKDTRRLSPVSRDARSAHGHSKLGTDYSPRIFETLGITGTDTKLFATVRAITIRGPYNIHTNMGWNSGILWRCQSSWYDHLHPHHRRTSWPTKRAALWRVRRKFAGMSLLSI